MTVQDTPPLIQAIRRVYESDLFANRTTLSSDILHLICHFDISSGRDIILWDDIQSGFKDVIHVRSGTTILPFLKGPNFKK